MRVKSWWLFSSPSCPDGPWYRVNRVRLCHSQHLAHLHRWVSVPQQETHLFLCPPLFSPSGLSPEKHQHMKHLIHWEVTETERTPNVSPLAFLTQRRCIISGAVVHQFSADGDSHRAKQLRLKDDLLCNSHRKPALQFLKWRDGHGYDVGVFSRCFPGVSPVNLNPWIVYNHMDAVIMGSDWDPYSPNILESEKVMYFAQNKQDLSDSPVGGRLFSRGKFPEGLSPEGWPSGFITNTQRVKVFCRWQTPFFRQKCDEESVGQTGGETLLHLQLQIFFSSYKLLKTVTVTMLLLFGHVNLLCGKFLFIILSQLSVCMINTPLPCHWLTCSHWFGWPTIPRVTENYTGSARDHTKFTK